MFAAPPVLPSFWLSWVFIPCHLWPVLHLWHTKSRHGRVPLRGVLCQPPRSRQGRRTSLQRPDCPEMRGAMRAPVAGQRNIHSSVTAFRFGVDYLCCKRCLYTPYLHHGCCNPGAALLPLTFSVDLPKWLYLAGSSIELCPCRVGSLCSVSVSWCWLHGGLFNTITCLIILRCN